MTKKTANQKENKQPKNTGKQTYNYKTVGQKLGLMLWQIKLAEKEGFIQKDQNGKFNPRQINALAKNPQNIQHKILMHTEINANQAAEFLEINRPQFNWLVEQGEIEAYGIGEFKYGQFLTYRRIDLQKINKNGRVQKLLEQRNKQQKARRTQGAKQAQSTRQKNQILKQEIQQKTLEILDIIQSLPDKEALVAKTNFWLRLVSAYADIENEKNKANRKRQTTEGKSELSSLFNLKNTALETLCTQGSDFIRMSFFDFHTIWLCERCKENCMNWGIPFSEYEGCKKCTVNHYHSLLRIKIKTLAGQGQFFVPYPIAAKWKAPKQDEFTKIMLAGHSSLQRPPGISQKTWKNLAGISEKMAAKETFQQDKDLFEIFHVHQTKNQVVEWIAQLPLEITYYYPDLLDRETIKDKQLQMAYPKKVACENLKRALKEIQISQEKVET